jgi:dephospho-CoA kinase
MATRVIGLAGRPGSGKSTVARALAGKPGVEAIDLDRVAWQTYATGTSTYERLVARFGPGILSDDGGIDREALASIALADAAARQDLEAIVHPAVGDRLSELKCSAKQRGVSVLVVEGALLASSPHVDRSIFDAVFWLEASEETRRNRLRAGCREGHSDRMGGVKPDDWAIVVDAEATISQVVECVWRSIER